VDDTQLLDEALPELKARTELKILYTDGGYGSPETDDALRENEVEQIQTAIRGRKSSAACSTETGVYTTLTYPFVA